MLENINELIEKKILKYPDKIQKIIRKAVELAGSSQPSEIKDHLEGFVRDMTKENNIDWKEL
jgi:hypothetical protein